MDVMTEAATLFRASNQLGIDHLEVFRAVNDGSVCFSMDGACVCLDKSALRELSEVLLNLLDDERGVDP
jgi:hypothetical protein